MKKLWAGILSSAFSMLILFLLILVIGTATFIENSFDTNTAKLLFYNAKYFEVLLVILIILYVGLIIKKNLFTKEKAPQLVLHLSFVLMIIGAGVTRYFGYEADMHVLENESVSIIYTSEPYINLKLANEKREYSSNSPIYFSQIQDNYFKQVYDIKGYDKIKVEFKEYIYTSQKELHNNLDSSIHLTPEKPAQKNSDALIIDLFYRGKSYETVLYYDDSKYIQDYTVVNIDALQIELSYGPKLVRLPFALQLDKFTLSKYPGSNLPSASESEITLIDKRYNFKEKYTISKNQVLDYDGYRFFQSSYDDNEKGTILSVNYDFYGTRITYIGYFLLVLGSIFILLSKNSNFSQLGHKIKAVRDKRKSLLISVFFLLGFNILGFGQNAIQNTIDKDHSEEFGHLIVQNSDGRFSSVNTLALDIIHKISGKDNLNIVSKGKMNAMHIFLDMQVNPIFWREQKMIVVGNKELRNMLGLSGKTASFNDFFNDNHYYKLDEFAKKAFQKKAAKQTKLDKEVIKATERVNIFLMTLNGTYLKLFPVQESSNTLWVNWKDSLAFIALTGVEFKFHDDLKFHEFNYNNIMRSYLISTIYARESNNYTIPNRFIGYLNSIQRQFTPSELIPSKSKIEAEILYNKTKIFEYLKYLKYL